MAKIDWSNPLSRVYQQGIDRVVVYHGDYPGEPWHGVSSLGESYNTPDSSIYQDGLLIQKVHRLPVFSASVESYSEPDILKRCMGMFDNRLGLTITGQKIKPFHFTFRTKIGDQLSGLNHYRVHLVYQATCSDPGTKFETIDEKSNVVSKNYSITSVPIEIPGSAPSSHLYIDSRSIHPDALLLIEDQLYGTEGSDPSMIMPEDLMEIIAGV